MDMANIQRWKHKFTTTYHVTVQRKGFGIEYKSFPTLTEVKKWTINLFELLLN